MVEKQRSVAVVARVLRGRAQQVKTQFSEQQIKNWRAYERVRIGGRFNMFDPKARRATGLSGEDYSFVMRNYSELKEAAESK